MPGSAAIRQAVLFNRPASYYSDLTLSGNEITDAVRTGEEGVAQPYLLSLGPVALWGLGEPSGQALDATGNGHHGTVTLGAGQRDVAALDDRGDGAMEFDGAATKVQVADAAALQDIWDGGGSVVSLIDPASAGEGGGIVVGKGNFTWAIHVVDAGGSLNLRLFTTWTTSNGRWGTSQAVIPLNERSVCVVTYDSSSTANDPIFYIYNSGGLQVLTVGDGLVEGITPAGSKLSDSGQSLVVGNFFSDQTRTFDGVIDEVAVFDRVLTAQEVISYVARAVFLDDPVPGGFGLYDDARAQATISDLGITETQGHLTFRLAMGHANTAFSSGYLTVFRWADNDSNLLELRYDYANTRWEFERSSAGGGVALTASGTFTLDQSITLSIDWGASTLGLSVDGARNTSADASIPTLSATSADIGSNAGTSEHILSRLLWDEAGSGTLTDADASLLNNYGNRPPNLATLSKQLSNANVTGVWDAKTGRFEVAA